MHIKCGFLLYAIAATVQGNLLRVESSYKVTAEHRELQNANSTTSANFTDYPKNFTDYPKNVSEITPYPTSAPSDSLSSSDSNSSGNGISELEFAIGFLILAVSCLMVACVTAAIKTNTSCYEEQITGKDFMGDFDDDSLDDSVHSSEGNEISLSGIKRKKNTQLLTDAQRSQHSSAGGRGGRGLLKRSGSTSRHAQGGPEFVKLQHFEQGRYSVDQAGPAGDHSAYYCDADEEDEDEKYDVDGGDSDGDNTCGNGSSASRTQRGDSAGGLFAHKRISTM